MAEDKQLTVAELLARSSKERERRGSAGASEQGTDGKEVPRRRRRRSLDEGGISVAELTGSIKRVQSEPARSRHSETDTSAAAAASAAQAAKKPTQPSASNAPADSDTSKPADAKSVGAKSADAPAASAKTAPAEPASAAKPSTTKTEAARPASAKSEDAKPEAKTRADNAAKPSDKADVKAADASVGKETPAAAKPQAASEAEAEKKADTPSNDDTTVISKVEADYSKSEPQKPEAQKTAAKPAKVKADTAKPAAKPAEAKVDETTVMPVQTAAAKPVSSADAPQVEDAATGEIPVVPADSHGDAAVAQREDEDFEDEEDGKLSAVSIVVLALIGIILGAIVFKGFEVLWGRFDRIIVSILALVVTGAMVGIVHALRTARDSVSMTLAAVVGLVLTFGPLLIIIL
ncbi:CPBP family intramembrane metalloprotease [Corynebacterium stationis]|uniref:CPBP family intramembrane metalloprotease n=2 Tax=Corynebacterium stationis TaxID=1705 RepID=UPI00263AA8E1|nr:CPBP family intramembrane metalloprotease [Corynebacterium stationis]